MNIIKIWSYFINMINYNKCINKRDAKDIYIGNYRINNSQIHFTFTKLIIRSNLQKKINVKNFFFKYNLKYLQLYDLSLNKVVCNLLNYHI